MIKQKREKKNIIKRERTKMDEIVIEIFIKFQLEYLVLFHFFSVVDGFEWLWMGIHRKNM